MRFAEIIHQRPAEQLRPTVLEVVDELSDHAGHQGAAPAGETHFRVLVVAEAFGGMPRIARQRLVNEIVADLLAGRVHAFSARLLAPTEWGPESLDGWALQAVRRHPALLAGTRAGSIDRPLDLEASRKSGRKAAPPASASTTALTSIALISLKPSWWPGAGQKGA